MKSRMIVNCKKARMTIINTWYGLNVFKGCSAAIAWEVS
jgi:hypothetical protein